MLFSTTLYLLSTAAPFSLWLLSANMLLILGCIGLISQLGIFIGFLWVIDLGVGLIFLLFLSHLTVMGETRLEAIAQKQRKILYSICVLPLLLILTTLSSLNTNGSNSSLPYYNMSWVDYHLLLMDREITQLNLLREIFFYNNSWEFIIVNYLVLVGLMGMVIFNFTISDLYRRSLLRYLLVGKKSLSSITPLFIRDQNFINQQQTSSSVRLWSKVIPNLRKK